MAWKVDYPDVLNRHRVPLVITGFGLLVAIGLGLAPLFKGSAPEPRQDVAASVAELVDATLSDRIDAIDLKLSNLDKAVTRNHGRLVTLRDSQEKLSDSVALVRSLEPQVDTLNKAVPRLNSRLRLVAENGPDDMKDIRQSVSALEAQVATLNKAVTRLSERIRALSDPQAPTAQLEN